MDSTHVQTPLPPHPLPVKVSASKLPVKRKILDTSSSSTPLPDPLPDLDPNPNFLSPNTLPDFSDDASAADVSLKPPPFKFHRIWTEPDEIRFLQGLLDSASDGLVFPRDLHVFYDRFSNTMSQPYTKSQLSEKLRRLRKKFRVISSRLARGFDASMLSPHDRALYGLSIKLWSPEFSSISPFASNPSQESPNTSKSKIEYDSIGVHVSFSPSLPPSTNRNQNQHCDPLRTTFDDDVDDGDGKLGEFNVDPDVGRQREDLHGPSSGYSDGKLGGVAAKTVLDVFDQCLREARVTLLLRGMLCPDLKSTQAVSLLSKEGNAVDFGRRWQEQQALELDVFARRLRLVLENSLHQH